MHSTAEQVSAPQEYVLKVSDVNRVSDLVVSIGGTVSHTMPSLGYVGVELSIEQVKLLSRSALVSRISEGSAKLAGYWWDYKATPEIPEIEDVDSMVAGFWWDYKAAPETPEIEDVDTSLAGFWWDYKAIPEAPKVPEADEIEYGGIAELEANGEITVAGFYWQY